MFKKIYFKYFQKKKYFTLKENIRKKELLINFSKNLNVLEEVSKNLKKKNISFLHSGHIGDIICALPLLKYLGKKSKITIYLNHKNSKNFQGQERMLNYKSIKMLLPLLKKQKFILKAEVFKNQKIDINLDYFRKLPINFNIDPRKYYGFLTGLKLNYENKCLILNKIKNSKKKIIIMRSLRRQNPLIDYSFLNTYPNIYYLGLKDEFEDLKKKIPSLIFYNCKNFLELGIIINSCKIFIGNSSLGFALAEALKVTRLLEYDPLHPMIDPIGKKSHVFFHQKDFENSFKRLYLN
ncbi:MAG: hypothetical protein FJ375_04860 [Pelagibacterales bacterium]|nr:hypothetical protein [Pelagibacterales bacterium]